MKGSHSNSHRRKVGLKSAVILGMSATVVIMTALGIQGVANPAASSACVCSADTTYNSALPSSHPNNRCASQASDLSWKTWITGQSRSNQFHFVDLFELLHGHKDKPMDTMRPANSQQNIR